jgi:hypothetical protein
MAMLLFVAVNCPAARLDPSAAGAFEDYIATLETRLARQHAKPETYLNLETIQRNSAGRPTMPDDLRVEAVNGGTWPVGRALLHHWRSSAFVPNTTPKKMLALLRDFNHLSTHYAPNVVSSRALTDDGETAALAVRFRQQRFLTVVLDAEYRVETKLSGNDRGYSISRSTHIWQIDDPGTAHERRRAEGEDDGFLWRLNSYWSFARMRDGLQIECEAVSLTRDVPPGLGWLITPIIGDLPREMLEFTLRATKDALTAGNIQGAN